MEYALNRRASVKLELLYLAAEQSGGVKDDEDDFQKAFGKDPSQLLLKLGVNYRF